MTNDPAGLNRVQGLSEAVAALSRRLEGNAASASRRRLLTGLVLAIVLAIVGSYLSWLHNQIRTFAEPTTLVELASADLQPRLEAEVARVGERLVEQAPTVMDRAEKIILDSPPQVVATAEEFLATQFDGQMALLEDRVYTLVSGVIQEMIAQAGREGIDLNDDEQLDKLVDDSAPRIRAELDKAIKEIYAEYLKAADGIGALVERITSGEQLEPAEERQKEILVTGLAIIRKLETDPSRSPVQRLIRGEIPDPR